MESSVSSQVTGDLRQSLDHYRRRLERAACVTIVDEMIRSLGDHYDAAARAGELPEFRETCGDHPLHLIALQDPFTERAFSKPRGYAGDAVMLDYIYRPRPLDLTDLGTAIHFMTTSASNAKSIIWRRDHLGTEIARTVLNTRNARILALASGHLRELDVVRTKVHHRKFEVVALDEDAASLQEAVNANADFNIFPVTKSISYLFRDYDGKTYDLIYSAGLLDDLPGRIAARVLGRLLGMLAPSGRLILGSNTPENYGRGYMDGMMGWRPIYRNEADMAALLEAGHRSRLYRDEPGNMVYLEVSANRN